MHGYERVGRLLYGLQRSCGGVDGLRRLQDDARVDIDLRQRGAVLVGRYAMLYARFTHDADEVAGHEVDAFLGDVAAWVSEVNR